MYTNIIYFMTIYKIIDYIFSDSPKGNSYKSGKDIPTNNQHQISVPEKKLCCFQTTVIKPIGLLYVFMTG